MVPNAALRWTPTAAQRAPVRRRGVRAQRGEVGNGRRQPARRRGGRRRAEGGRTGETAMTAKASAAPPDARDGLGAGGAYVRADPRARWA